MKFSDLLNESPTLKSKIGPRIARQNKIHHSIITYNQDFTEVKIVIITNNEKNAEIISGEIIASIIGTGGRYLDSDIEKLEKYEKNGIKGIEVTYKVSFRNDLAQKEKGEDVKTPADAMIKSF